MVYPVFVAAVADIAAAVAVCKKQTNNHICKTMRGFLKRICQTMHDLGIWGSSNIQTNAIEKGRTPLVWMAKNARKSVSAKRCMVSGNVSARRCIIWEYEASGTVKQIRQKKAALLWSGLRKMHEEAYLQNDAWFPETYLPDDAWFGNMRLVG